MASLPPGVPPLPPGLSSLFAVPILLTADSVSAVIGVGVPVWGIFDQNNNPVITADNTLSFEYKRTRKIPDYTVEEGDFSSYDKVTIPFSIKMSFSKAGSDADRAQFLTTLEAASASLDLYNVAMPELVYPNCNIEMYGFRRTAENGATLIVVDIGLQEIRQTATQTFSNTATPVAADQVNTGPVQTTTPTTSQQSALQSLM